MKVFISWSGDQSKAIAETLRRWLPGVIQSVRPYFSPEDIVKGSRWTSEVAKELSESKVGLICLTRENLQAPWILFEAGALSKNLDKSKVCPILFGLEPTDVEGPLVQFEAAKFDMAEMKRVVTMINSESEAPLAQDVLDSVFEMWWPQLGKTIDELLTQPGATSPTRLRSERALLEEILQLTRSSAGVRLPTINPQAIRDLVEGLQELVRLTIETDQIDVLKPPIATLYRAINYLSARQPNSNPASLSDLKKILIERDIILPPVPRLPIRAEAKVTEGESEKDALPS